MGRVKLSAIVPKPQSKKRRVLLIDLGPEFGGIETYLVSLAELLSGTVDLYVLCVLPELSARLANVGVKVIRLPLPFGVFTPLRFLATLIVVPVLLVGYGIHTVQLNGFLDSLLILPARLLGRSAVYTRHGTFEVDLFSWLRQPHKFLARKLARWSVRYTNHVVCVSQAVGDSVRPVLPPSQYTVIANWVSGQKPFRPPNVEKASGMQVLCCSRLEHYKGVHLLVEVARRMPQVQFTIVGEGSHRVALEQSAFDLPNVHFAGFQRNLFPFYDRASIFVMPSMGPEGLPIVSLEAMAHGLPCIFSDLPVHHEITDGGRAARLFCVGSAESLFDALEQLLDSPETCRRYAAEAHRMVAARYHDGVVRDAYLRVLAG